jgi:hypothetical protein
VSHEPCEGCALTTDAAANCEPQNNLTAQLCVLGGIPFYCHRNIDWQNPATHVMAKEELREQGITICEGWRREVSALARTGCYKEHGAAKREIARFGVTQLNKFVNAEPESFEKRDALESLEWAVKELNQDRRAAEAASRKEHA